MAGDKPPAGFGLKGAYRSRPVLKARILYKAPNKFPWIKRNPENSTGNGCGLMKKWRANPTREGDLEPPAEGLPGV